MNLDQVKADAQKVVDDLNAIVPTPSSDPVVSITVTTQSGATLEFIPKA